MIDKRKCYKMEQGYCRSDFSFYNKYPESADVDMYGVLALQAKSGTDKWYCVGTYTWKGKYTSEHVMVLVNDKGDQIETCGFGWYNVPTEHDLAEKRKVRYNNFLAALAECGKLCPDGASRWFNEAVLENFEHTFEEELCYGED